MGSGYHCGMAQIPINPATLRWAMEASKCTDSDLAAAAHVDLSRVHGWLAGDQKPTTTELHRIGDRLGRSNQFFLLKKTPSGRDEEALFRRAVKPDSKNHSQEVMQVRAARRIQRIAKWAVVEGADTPLKLPSMDDQSASRYADTMRSHLDWDTRSQVPLSKTQVFKALRKRIEETGVIVLLQDAGEGNFRGFSLPDPLAPVIFINAAYKQPALRTYTLLHELAHLGRGDEQVCYEPKDSVERWCERFAADFLMPASHVRAYIATKNWTTDQFEDPETAVRLVSNRYGSSWHSTAIRLRELGYCSDSIIDRIKGFEGEPYEPGFSREPRTTPVLRLSEFGSTFPSLVIRAVENHALPDLDARRYLRATGEQLREITLMLRQGAS